MKIRTLRTVISKPLTTLSALALGGVLLTGCAGKPPTAEMAIANSALQSAIESGASTYAAPDLIKAQDKWSKAEAANNKHDYEAAQRWAEQAEIDARVAQRKAQAAKVTKALDEAKKSIQDIREENQRLLQLNQ